jgi:hypothetical protein
MWAYSNLRKSKFEGITAAIIINIYVFYESMPCSLVAGISEMLLGSYQDTGC